MLFYLTTSHISPIFQLRCLYTRSSTDKHLHYNIVLSLFLLLYSNLYKILHPIFLFQQTLTITFCNLFSFFSLLPFKSNTSTFLFYCIITTNSTYLIINPNQLILDIFTISYEIYLIKFI